jgi:putative spermidine/putrescine transport system substrate-binding protein
MTLQNRRRTILKAGAALAAGPIIGFPSIARAADPFIINCYGGEFEKFMRAEIIPEFEKQSGIKTKLDIGLANNWVATCRAAGPGKAPYDFLMLNAIWGALLQTEGYLEPIPTEKLSNMADLYPVALRKDNYAVVGWFQPMGVAYAPDTIKTAPVAWKDLWTNPDIKGNLGLYTITNTVGMMFLLMTGQIFGGSEYKTDVAFDQIRKLKPFLQVDFSGTMETMLSRGEVAAAPLDFPAVARLTRKGVNLEMKAPAEGSFAFDQVFHVMKGAKRKAETYTWINYILSPEVQLKWVKGFYVSPSNTKVQIPDDLKTLIPITGDRMKSIVTFDWAAANKNRDVIIDRWNKEMT